jgi:peroxiredoxin family protein
MISLDWKERLIKDADDFCKNKLIKKDYRFDVIYNAYPVREGNNIPNEVLTLVSKEIAKFLEKEQEQNLEFLDYLWYQGYSNGKFIACSILNKIYSKNSEKYYDKMIEFLGDAKYEEDKSLIIDKVFFPILKKSPDKYLQTVYAWTTSGDLELEMIALKTLTKLCKAKKELTKSILRHLENKWAYAPQELIKGFSLFFKEVAKIDKALYLDTFDFYDNSRDPNVVEIITSSISFYNENIEKIVEEWTKSGNARLKKSAIAGLKHLKRIKNRG